MREVSPAALGPVQWLSFIAILLISVALIVLIWILTGHAIDDETADIEARTEQQARSVAYVAAQDLHRELLMVDQSLAIIQETWKQNSGQVDLGAWRKQALALTAVADDIFVANERGIIVQGTLPQSIGQGFGSTYVSYPNGSLELFEPDGSKSQPGRTTVGTIEGTKLEARQFLMYVVRPLDQPRGFMVGASFRSSEITRLFAGANLGQAGTIGLIDLKRGAIQALVGKSLRNATLDIAQSDLVAQMRKNEAGVWSGAMPTDRVERVVAYQRIPDRPMAVMVGISTDSANEALSGLVAWAKALAVLGSMIVAAIAGIVIWGIASARETRLRERAREHAELNLTNTRRDLELATARVRLNAVEAATLISSRVDGVARLDAELRLRQWNPRFAELSCVPLDEAARGVPIEDLLRAQAQAGVFGDAETAEHAMAARITVFHTGGAAVVPLTQFGPGGQEVAMLVRPVVDEGFMVILAGPENSGLSGGEASIDFSAEPESV